MNTQHNQTRSTKTTTRTLPLLRKVRANASPFDPVAYAAALEVLG